MTNFIDVSVYDDITMPWAALLWGTGRFDLGQNLLRYTRTHAPRKATPRPSHVIVPCPFVCRPFPPSVCDCSVWSYLVAYFVRSFFGSYSSHFFCVCLGTSRRRWGTWDLAGITRRTKLYSSRTLNHATPLEFGDFVSLISLRFWLRHFGSSLS